MLCYQAHTHTGLQYSITHQVEIISIIGRLSLHRAIDIVHMKHQTANDIVRMKHQTVNDIVLFGMKRTKSSHYYFIYNVVTSVTTSQLSYSDYNTAHKIQLYQNKTKTKTKKNCTDRASFKGLLKINFL